MSLSVIKIGTNLLTTPDRALDVNHLRHLVWQVGQWVKMKGGPVVLVSSGAITCGAHALGVVPTTIQDKQAAASVGQVLLMQEYSRWFAQQGQCVGQILLTKDGMEHPQAAQNARNTIHCLLQAGVVPIINENDSVATTEIGPKFGDNDELSAMVAVLLGANRLVLLSDVDGVYTDNPKSNPLAQRLDRLTCIDDTVWAMVHDQDNGRSRGGMRSKLMAASTAMAAGIEVLIANGRTPHVLVEWLQGTVHGTVIRS
ncbi:glutamate 5-kinase [bacterium]|nr:glutamate 5-kinase [bacterium]